MNTATYTVSKLHTDGFLAGVTTTETTSVPFTVGEVITAAPFSGGGYTVIAVTENIG